MFVILIFYLLIDLRERERERDIDLLSCLFMHSLVDSCMCPNQGSNHNPVISGWCSNRVAPSLSGTRERFHGRQFSHGPGHEDSFRDGLLCTLFLLLLYCNIEWNNYTSHHNAESVGALSLFSCNYTVPSGGGGRQWHQSMLLMSSLLHNLVLVAVTAENTASQGQDVGNGSRLFSAYVAISGYSALTLLFFPATIFYFFPLRLLKICT